MMVYGMLLSAVGLLALSNGAMAQDADFTLTYHVERTPAAQLNIEACADAVEQAAEQAELRHDQQIFSGQLVMISGGAEGAGMFVVQCIAVDNTTVTVVQGIDYQQQKGPLGEFADKTFTAVKAAIK